MTESQEFHAPTVEEAVQKASLAMGAAVDELSYEVVDTGSVGFLGIGAREARITVNSDLRNMRNRVTDVSQAEEGLEGSGASVLPEERSEASGFLERQVGSPVSGDLIDDIKSLVSSILKAMDLEARIDVYDAGDFIAVDVASEETGLFIGQKGETIDALQYLVNVAVYKKSPAMKRIVLDSEGYRQRRVEAIQGMAHRSARRAVRERSAIELPPMNASERRIVHIYLKDNTMVTTASEGSGDERRVKVFPTGQ